MIITKCHIPHPRASSPSELIFLLCTAFLLLVTAPTVMATISLSAAAAKLRSNLDKMSTLQVHRFPQNVPDDNWISSTRLPDGWSQIFILYAFGPSGLKDYGSTTLRCKIWIAPPHPPPCRNPRKGRDQILPSGNTVSSQNSSQIFSIESTPCCRYLNKALFRCILNKKARPVHKIIIDIFNIVAKFSIVLTSRSVYTTG